MPRSRAPKTAADITWLVESLAQYGPLLLLGITVLAAFGLPAPASLGLITAGAFCRFGVLPLPETALAGLIGTVAGDHLAYLLGERLSGRIRSRKIGRHLDQAEAALERWGVLQVFFSRFVFPTVLTPATNYFAGLSRYRLSRFTPAVALGEAVYVGGFMAIGWVFSAQVALANGIAARVSLLIAVIAFGGYCLFILVRSART